MMRRLSISDAYVATATLQCLQMEEITFSFTWARAVHPLLLQVQAEQTAEWKMTFVGNSWKG